MGLLSMLKGLDSSLGDVEIASDMLKDSKFEVITLAKATLEVTNPQLRELVETQLFNAITEYHLLSDLALQKSWFKSSLTPDQCIVEDIDTLNQNSRPY